LFYKNFNKHFGASQGRSTINSLKEAVDQYNTECKSTCALMKTTEDENFVIAIVTPLMKRICLSLEESEKELFMDAT